MTRSQTLTIAVVAVGALAGGFVYVLAAGQGDADASSEPVAAAPEEAAGERGDAAQKRLACQFEVGDELGYSLDLKTTMAVSPGALGGQGQPDQTFIITTKAHLTWRAIQQLPGGETIVAGRLTGVEARANAKNAMDPKTDAALQHAYLVHLSPRCEVRRFARHKSVRPRLAVLFQAVADLLDIRLPGAAASGYEASHTDQYGRYTATYTPQPGAAGRQGSWQRKRGAYAATTDAQADSEVRFRPIGMVTAFTPSPELGLVSATFKGSLLGTRQGRRMLSETLEHRISRTNPVVGAFEGVDLDPKSYVWGRLRAGAMASLAEEETLASLAGLPLDEAWKRFSAMRSGKGGHMKAVNFLSTWLKANPKGAQELVARMAKGQFDESERAMIVHAMSKAGTPESRAALLELTEGQGFDYKTRTQAAAALGDLVNPDADTVKRLAEMARGEGAPSKHGMTESASALAIGAILKRTHMADGEVTRAARQELNGLLGSQDPKLVRQGLLSVGNSGDPSFLDAAKAQLKAQDERTRAAAIRAMRMMDAAKVQPVFTEVLKTEASQTVIEELAWAHAKQIGAKKTGVNGEQLSSYERRLKSAKTRELRRAIIEVLGRVAKHNPAALKVLATWFWQETEPELKKVIGQFLSAQQLMQHKG